MNKEMQVFSKYYSDNSIKNTDTPLFRNRLLKLVEDFFNSGWPHESYLFCRSKLGVDIQNKSLKNDILSKKFYLEEAFINEPIDRILDLITVVYNSLLPHKKEHYDKNFFEKYIEEINLIFQEESMCYILNENCCVRYYPDEEFNNLVKSTLISLNEPMYSAQLITFNETLDNLYKKRNHESPICDLFKCLEVFVLSITKNINSKILNEPSVDKLLSIFEKCKIEKNVLISDEEKEISNNFKIIFVKWIGVCNKFRHGKSEQAEDRAVDEELFNYIFSVGISIFRYLLETNAASQGERSEGE